MGFHKYGVRFASDTASMMRWMYPFGSSAKQGDQLQPAREFVSVEIRLLSGEHTILRIVSTSFLGGLNAVKLSLRCAVLCYAASACTASLIHSLS